MLFRSGAMALTLDGLGVDALGLNCSVGPKEAKTMAAELARYTAKPLIIKPNAGLPVIREGKTCFDVTPEEFGADMAALAIPGVGLVGGCCGTTPAYIAQLAGLKAQGFRPSPGVAERRGCSLRMVEGLEDNTLGVCEDAEDLEGWVEKALEQADEDISALRLNLESIQSPEEARAIVSAVQEAVALPLIFRAGSPAMLESILRVYAGTAMVYLGDASSSVQEELRVRGQKYGAIFVE